MTSMITTVHFPTCVFSKGLLYKFQNIHKNKSTHSQINIALKRVHKHILVSNEILIKLLFFQSHYIISYFLLPSKYTRCKMSETIFLSLCLFKCKHGKLHAYLFNLSTKNSAIARDKYYNLISYIEMVKFSHNFILSVFQTNRMRIFYLLHSP